MTMSSFGESSRIRRPLRATRKVFDLPAATATLPLIRRVVADIIDHKAALAHLEITHDRLAAAPRADWDKRREQFRVADEINHVERDLDRLQAELDALGITLLDAVRGIAGFPTIVNGSLAYLLYTAADGDIRYWRYRDQPRLRPIPACWTEQTPDFTAKLEPQTSRKR